MNNLTKENNNFNLIRLFACLQVLVLHSFSFYQEGENSFFLELIWLFPGVIIFFSISGFLIAKSLENSSSKSYATKRFKRIYPALFVNLLITCFLLFYFNSAKLNFDFFKYFIAQITLFQFYTPESMKAFGMGHHPNGALWTISIELQFYIAFFILAKITNWKNKSIFFKNTFIAFLVISSCFVNYFTNKSIPIESTTYKLLFNSLAYHFTFFGVGILLWINFKSISKLFFYKMIYWLLALSIFIFIIIFRDIPMKRYQFDAISLLYLLVLIGFIFSFAFSNTKLSYTILKNNDISYGTYIYHVLVINTFLQLKVSSNYFIAIYLISITLGIISWLGIERISLKSKRLEIN